jgi:hypothetical protein
MSGFLKLLSYMFLFILVSVVLPANAQQGHPLISNKYPQCKYTIIDTVEVKSRVDVAANLLNATQHKKAFRKITNKLTNIATRAGADIVVLVAKRQSKSNRQNYLAYSAELLKTCAVDTSIPIKIAKFNNKGMAQLALPSSTIEIENTLVIKAPVFEKRKQPALQNKIVSIKSGAYSLKLGVSLTHLIEVLGTPTVEMHLSEPSQILMYGRQHLFEFRDEKLSAVDSFNPHFTSDLKNRLEFDDRLDDVKWEVAGDYIKQKRLTVEQAKRVKNSEIVMASNSKTLRVFTEELPRSRGIDPSYVVSRFRLSQTKYIYSEDLIPPDSRRILAFIDKQLKRETPSFSISDIPYKPTMSAWISPVKRLYTFGQHVVIEAIGDRVATIHIIENLYTEESPLYKSGHWKVGQYEQSMSEEAARLIAGDNGQYFNEELEIVDEGVNKRFYFYEQKQQVKLYAAEINFY